MFTYLHPTPEYTYSFEASTSLIEARRLAQTEARKEFEVRMVVQDGSSYVVVPADHCSTFFAGLPIVAEYNADGFEVK